MEGVGIRVVTSAALLALFLGSCATMQTVSLSKRTRIYVARQEAVVNAVVDYCNDRGFPIQSYTKELGLVNTDYREGDPVFMRLFGQIRMRLNFQARQLDSTRVRLILFASAEDDGGAFGRWRQSALLESQAEQLYEALFNGVEQYLGTNVTRDDIGGIRIDRNEYSSLVGSDFKEYERLKLATLVFVGGRTAQTYLVGEDEDCYIATISRTNGRILQVPKSSLKELKVH